MLQARCKSRVECLHCYNVQAATATLVPISPQQARIRQHHDFTFVSSSPPPWVCTIATVSKARISPPHHIYDLDIRIPFECGLVCVENLVKRASKQDSFGDARRASINGVSQCEQGAFSISSFVSALSDFARVDEYALHGFIITAARTLHLSQSRNGSLGWIEGWRVARRKSSTSRVNKRKSNR